MFRKTWITGLLLSGCVPAYVQPGVNEPHAMLNIRHIVHAANGPMYEAETFLAEHSIDSRTLEPGQAGESNGGTWEVRVRPETAEFRVMGHSFHYEQRPVQRSRQVSEQYSCPQQQCSYATGSYQCTTVTQTCTRSRTEYYTAMETVEVDDDACQRSFMLAAAEGHRYLVQFDYLGSGQCEAQCFEQTAPVSSVDGTSVDPSLSLVACPLVLVGR